MTGLLPLAGKGYSYAGGQTGDGALARPSRDASSASKRLAVTPRVLLRTVEAVILGAIGARASSESDVHAIRGLDRVSRKRSCSCLPHIVSAPSKEKSPCACAACRMRRPRQRRSSKRDSSAFVLPGSGMVIWTL